MGWYGAVETVPSTLIDLSKGIDAERAFYAVDDLCGDHSELLTLTLNFRLRAAALARGEAIDHGGMTSNARAEGHVKNPPAAGTPQSKTLTGA